MERARRLALQEWMARLADGDRSAFDPVFELLWPTLRRFALNTLKSEAEADDAAQQALLKVFARAAEFDSSRDALAWTFAIAANECRTIRKKARRRREAPVEALEAVCSEGAGTEERVIARELELAAAEALGHLSPADVQTILAAVRDDPAARPEVPAATFRKRLQRAMERLRATWRSRHGES